MLDSFYTCHVYQRYIMTCIWLLNLSMKIESKLNNIGITFKLTKTCKIIETQLKVITWLKC